MEKIKLINGWTKETVMAQVKKYNNGNRCVCTPRKSPYAGQCVYLAPDGNRCAVGCFIPTHYTEESSFDGTSEDLLKAYPELHDFMPFQGWALSMFQETHDQARDSEVYTAIQKFLDKEVE